MCRVDLVVPPFVMLFEDVLHSFVLNPLARWDRDLRWVLPRDVTSWWLCGLCSA